MIILHHNDGVNSHETKELRRCAISAWLLAAYRRPTLRRPVIVAAERLEHGQLFSWTLRRILQSCHGVDVGAYSYGECLIPGIFPRGVTVGRYVSVAPGVRVFLRNHPMDRLSMHPFFYNHELGVVGSDTIGSGSLFIGHDAWLGQRALIMPGCARVGIGSVIAAGAVVTHDIPDFAVVGGVPARVIRFRFEPATCELILQSRWWEKSIDQCRRYLPAMIAPLGYEPSRHPLLTAVSRNVFPI